MSDAMPILSRRAAAMAVDVAILFAVLYPASLLILWLAGIRPHTGPQVYWMLIVSFSLPSWAYFFASDASGAGQTLGKRLLGIRVHCPDAQAAAGRTGFKLMAWELTHFGLFAMADQPGQPGLLGWSFVALGYGLLAATLAVAIRTRGRRSVHDVAANTQVEFKHVRPA